ncbi:transposase [Ensifer sp. SL37]|uniref:transposase n=1 Tax=Ensifer sp. SL37 TaxID=2995137 RepID=UPI0022753F78|nr:transposase [Ensifer sp. SL37]MCY1741082.1 transposase [Ensifer sp. SL37]
MAYRSFMRFWQACHPPRYAALIKPSSPSFRHSSLVRLGWFKNVHVKAPSAQETRALLNARRFIVDKVTGIENSMRANLRNFGLKVGIVSRRMWSSRARELAAGIPALEMLVESMLNIRDVLLQELRTLDRKLLETARADPVVQTLMTAPGVGAIVALTFRNAVDDAGRFKRSKDVGPWLGLTPSRYQSGQVDRSGHVTKAGDASVRTALYEAATTLLGRVVKWCALKNWGLRVARRSGMKKARVAGVSGILCGGPVSSVEEPLAEDDGELCLCLDPLPRRALPLLGRIVEDQI